VAQLGAETLRVGGLEGARLDPDDVGHLGLGAQGAGGGEDRRATFVGAPAAGRSLGRGCSRAPAAGWRQRSAGRRRGRLGDRKGRNALMRSPRQRPDGWGRASAQSAKRRPGRATAARTR
jgi:hypothetical protein